MRKILTVFLLCLLTLCACGCASSNTSPTIISNSGGENYKKTIFAVLGNKKSFITEDESAVYLNDYISRAFPEDTVYDITPYEYVYADFDNDTFEDLLVSFTPDLGIYLVLRYNGYDIFGYTLELPGIPVIKNDGSFSFRDENLTRYGHMDFTRTALEITYDAIADTETDSYEVDGMSVPAEQFESFLSKWEQTADINWTSLGVSKTEDISTETTSVVDTQPETNASYTNTQGSVTETVDNTTMPSSSITHIIDLSGYVVTTYTGYSGAGTAEITLNKDLFLSDHGSDISFKNDDAKTDYFSSTGDSSSAAEVLFSFINNVSLSEKSALKNGDVITANWKINNSRIKKYFDVSISFGSNDFTVSGLTEPITFDPMDYISLSYTGTAPCGQFNITTNTSEITDRSLADKIAQVCDEKNYSCSGTVLTPGDEINVCYTPVDLSDAKSCEKFIEKYGLLPTVTQRAFRLDGFSYHPTTLDQIDLSILSEADSLCRTKVEADDYLQIKDIRRERIYYVMPSPSNYSDNSPWNLYVVYRINATAEFWNLRNAPSVTKDISYFYVVEYQSITFDAANTMTHSGYDTIINPVGRNGGAGYVLWEKDGALLEEKPSDPDEEIIEHYCYPDGFATFAQIENVLLSKSGQYEVLEF